MDPKACDYTQRSIGKLVEQGEWLQREVIELRKDFKQMNEFRWTWLGKLGVFSGIITISITALMEYLIYRR